MNLRRRANRVCVVVFSKGTKLQGLEVPLERGSSFLDVDLLNLSPFEAEFLASEFGKTPGLYEQNVGDALRRALQQIEGR